MSFSEEKLERAVVELFAEEQIPHFHGDTIHKEMGDVLLREDLKQYLLNQYAGEEITLREIDGIIRKLDLYPSSALYVSNKAIMKLVADGFTIKREDRSKKDLFIKLIDFSILQTHLNEANEEQLALAAESHLIYPSKDNNIYKFVNQLEILGYEKRIPDGIVYINGLPLVVFEFKTSSKEGTTIKDAFTQLTVRYRRDIPELFKYNAFCVISDEYMAKIDKIKLPNTKIKLLQKLLAQAIAEFKKVNRIKGVDFTMKMKKLVDLYNERKDFQALQSDVLDDVAEQFANLFRDLQKERNSFMDLGIDFEEKAFYDILKAIAEKYNFEYPEDKLITLAIAVKTIVDDKAKYTDWSHRDDIKAELKMDLILVLAEHGYPPVPKDEVFKEIFEQAENFKKYSY